MRRINVLGITLKDYTMKESLKLTNQYLNSGALNTISYITTQILVEALEHPELKESIESMDMTLCGEVDILKADNMVTRSRIREVENDDFFREFIHRLASGKKSVFLIADSEAHMERLKAELLERQSNLIIAGSYLLNEFPTGVDSLINEINDVVPSVIISKLRHPMQEQLMNENKKMINAKIWLALPEQFNVKHRKGNHFYKLTILFYKKIFNRRVSKYNHNNNEKAE